MKQKYSSILFTLLIAIPVLGSIFSSTAQAGYEAGQYYSQRGYVSQYSAYEEKVFVSYYNYQPNMCVYSIPVYAPYWQSQYAYQCGYQYSNYGYQQVCVQRQWWSYSWTYAGTKTAVYPCQ